MTKILRTCDLHGPIDLPNGHCMKPSHLAKVYLLEKCLVLIWRSQEMKKYMCILGVYSSALPLSLLIQYGLFLIWFFLTLNYTHWFLQWPIFPRQKSHLAATDFLQEHICVLWSSHFSGFLFRKETDQTHSEAFCSVGFIFSNNFWG